ncbi:HAMP domain-containing sensor histidine kinase [Rossellomorea marisflavi]|uniref:HAMP domain-containing sensor histidine kinase n=1 Tax=Rossellomorea marisflavi TaxID=189381 RepID=UPI00207AED2C|nr:ATP-binding protein [Rossellomorea marisflavi]USK90420.1 HAMP domain-containing protein [Rossellomorea marisflavi]
MNKLVYRFKHTSLKVKWALAAGSAIFLAFFLFSFFQYHAIDKWLINEEENSFGRVLDEITVFFKQRGPNIQKQDIFDSQDLMKQIAEKDQTIRILDTEGNQVLEIRGESDTSFYVPFEPVRGKSVNLIESENKKMLIGRSPIRSSEFNGYVEIIQPLNRYETVMRNLFWMMSIIGIGALLISALIGYIMAGNFVKPLNNLSETMRSIERKGFHERVDIGDSADEITELSHIFNSMMSQIENSFQQQQQFVEDASHELRTPIQVLEGHLSLLNRWGKKDPTILEESLQVSLEELERIKRLVGELLELSRADREKQDLNNVRADVRKVAGKVLGDFEFLHTDYTFRITDSLSGPTEAVMQPRHLEQVLTIIFDNAVKYSDTGSVIEMVLKDGGERVIIEVRDEGIGIPESDLPKIFDRFYRVDKARSREKGGYGLGLAIASKLIQNYGGAIEADLNNPVGTVIRIKLNRV